MGFVIKNFNERISYSFPFFLRIAYSREGIQETCRSIYSLYIKTHSFILFQDIFKFTLPEQTIINEDTVEVMSNCLVQQYRGYRGINSSAQSQYYLLIPYSFF